MKNKKIRTVSVNARGQLVIPEDVRKDFGIESGSTLVMIEREGEIAIKKESDVIEAVDESSFWKAVSRASLENAWGEKDKIWDKFAKKGANK